MNAEAAPRSDPLAEASAWRIALTEHGCETSPEFDRWLTASLENQEAWAQVQASWDRVGALTQSDELNAMRRKALVRAAEAKRARIKPWWAAVAACLLALVAVTATLGVTQWNTSRPMTYATALDERRVITLADQSKITLDANSELEVNYTDDARKLVLLRGQARFDVMKDATRPFTVRALDKLVVATGTAFAVDLLGKSVVVTLIEGKVVVLKASDGPPSPAERRVQKASEVVLVAGQQLVASVGAPSPLAKPANVEKATSWEQGLLMFEDETLASVAARVSRYSERKIEVDPSVADLKISGVFAAGDVDTFVDAVSRYLPVKARTVDQSSIELSRRG